jgi:hypothetical protein
VKLDPTNPKCYYVKYDGEESKKSKEISNAVTKKLALYKIIKMY